VGVWFNDADKSLFGLCNWIGKKNADFFYSCDFSLTPQFLAVNCARRVFIVVLVVVSLLAMKFFFLVTITQAFFAPRAAPRSSIYRASFSLHSNVPASPLQPDSPETRATTTPEKAKTRPANLPRTSFPTSATLIMNPASSSLPFTATHLSIPDLFTSFLFDIPQYNEDVTSLLSSDPPTTMIISSRDGIYDSAHDSFATTRVRQRPPPDLQLWRNRFRKVSEPQRSALS